MRVRAGFIGGGMLALAALGFLLAFVVVGGASAHSNPCHPVELDDRDVSAN